MDRESVRALQSKISLKIHEFPKPDMTKPDPRLDELKRSYDEKFFKDFKVFSDVNYNRRRHRNVGVMNPFHKTNIEPMTEFDYRWPGHDKISNIDICKVEKSNLPLAGQLSPIGKKLFNLAKTKKARHICSSDWEMNKVNNPMNTQNQKNDFKPSMEKITSVSPQFFT